MLSLVDVHEQNIISSIFRNHSNTTTARRSKLTLLPFSPVIVPIFMCNISMTLSTEMYYVHQCQFLGN
jgi:hypothetical protein